MPNILATRWAATRLTTAAPGYVVIADTGFDVIWPKKLEKSNTPNPPHRGDGAGVGVPAASQLELQLFADRSQPD